MIPIFYYFQGMSIGSPAVVVSFAYYIALSAFCPLFSLSGIFRHTHILIGFLKWYARLYRNQGNLLCGPGPYDWGEQIVIVTGGTRYRHIRKGRALISRLNCRSIRCRRITRKYAGRA